MPDQEVKARKKSRKPRRSKKLVYKCFLCPNLSREGDSFEATYVEYKPQFVGGPVMEVRQEVKICRQCAIASGYHVKEVPGKKDPISTAE